MDDCDPGVAAKRILTRTTTTNYFIAGKGHPVLFLHGGGAGAAVWQPVMRSLPPSFCSIAPDLVGYGDSDKPHASYNRHFFSDWLESFMDVIGLEKCVFVGHSLGGAIALQFALDHPERVERLTLVCSAGLGLSLPVIPLLYGLLLYSFPSRTASRRLHSRLVHNPESLQKSFIEYSVEVCLKPGGSRAFWEGCGQAVLPIPLVLLKTISHRTLFIWGVEDRVFPLAHARRAARLMPHARLHPIPRAGHIPFFDQPGMFNDVLLKFLEEEC